MTKHDRQFQGVTRRGVISGAALLGVGVGLDHVLGGAVRGTPTNPTASGSSEDFYDFHQAGVATAAQDYLHFAAFDITSEAADDLRNVLEEWTGASARLTAGEPYQPVAQAPNEPPVDTGEAIGLGPSRLTLTIGFGPSLFGSPGHNRFGLARQRPAELQTLPAFQEESLDPSVSGGDLCVQACADDPQVAFHAIHVWVRRRCATPSKASGEPPPPVAARARRGTSWASKTAPTTSRRRRPTR